MKDSVGLKREPLLDRHATSLRRGFFALAAFAFVLTTLAAPGGADGSRYVDWAHAFWSGDPFALESLTFSPTGMPLSQWSHGPGLLATPFVGVFGERALRVLGLVFTAGTAWFFAQILLIATRGSRRDTVFLFAVALLGTHFGHYGLVHSSESLSYFPLTGALYWMLSRSSIRVRDAFVIGCFAYLLMLIRMQLALYCLPIFAWTTWTVLEGTTFRSFRSVRHAVFCLVAAGAPPVAVLLQNAGLMSLMVGNPKASPYVFGDGSFSSFNLMKPELKAVLVHSWHGLLAYHPLYGVIFCCFVATVLQAKTWKLRVLLATLFAAMTAHLYVQAAWYVWWLGTGTFGMRGLSVWFIVGVPALAAVLRTRFRTLAGIAILACCGWSFLLLIQTARPPVYVQYYVFRELVDSLRVAALDFYYGGAQYALLAGAATWLFRTDSEPSSRATRVVSNVLLYLYVYYAIEVNTLTEAPFAAFFDSWRWELRLLGAVLVPLGTALFLSEDRASASLATSSKWRQVHYARIAAAALGCVFVGTNVLFVHGVGRMAAHRTGYDRARYRYCSSVQVEEISATYSEYLRVPAFKGKKEALRRYLDGLDRRSCR